MSTEHDGPMGTFSAPFTVRGQRCPSYPYTCSPVEPGPQIQFDGSVILPKALAGKRINLRVVADSCAGDEFMPDHCRVDESNEQNNKSVSLPVTLPR